MPRPKGSKNKATLAKTAQPTRTAPAQSKLKASSSPVAMTILDALQEFQDNLTEAGEQIATMLTKVSEDFEALKGVCVPEESKATKTPVSSKTGTKKTTPVVDEEDEEDEDEEEEEDVNFDSMTVAQLEAFIEENDLDVDLEDYKGLSKKRQAVADAYDELEIEEDEEEEDEEDEEEDETEDEDEDEDDWDEPKKPARAGKAGRK